MSNLKPTNQETDRPQTNAQLEHLRYIRERLYTQNSELTTRAIPHEEQAQHTKTNECVPFLRLFRY